MSGSVWSAAAFSSAGVQERRDERGRAVQAGEVLVVINEQLLNALLEAMLALPAPPRFPLSRGKGQKE